MRRYLAELREGCRIIVTREIWVAYRAYWSPDAIAKRMEKWAAPMSDHAAEADRDGAFAETADTGRVAGVVTTDEAAGS